MADYVLTCCSTADLTKEHFEERDIHYVCFHYYLDGKEYPDDLGRSMPFHEFYQKMSAGAMTRTSQVNVDEFIAFFKPFLEEGKDILHVTLSSGLSGVRNSAMTARDYLLEQFPGRSIVIVDSLGASSGYGLLMDKLADLRDAAEPEVLFDGPDVLHPRRAHWESVWLVRHGPPDLPASQYGQRRAPGPAV